MKHYFTGKPCKRGHLANRLLSDRGCVECNKENLQYLPAIENMRKNNRYIPV